MSSPVRLASRDVSPPLTTRGGDPVVGSPGPGSPASPPSGFATNGGIHRQFFVFFVVSGLIIAFELVFFLLIVVPQVRGPLGGMLATIRRQLGLPPPSAGRSWAPRIGASALGVMHDREQEYVRRANLVAVVSGSLLAAVPLLCAAGIWFGSRPLRNEGRAAHTHTVGEILLTFLAIAAFQGVFFYFGKQWLYAGEDEQVLGITKVYDHDGEATRNVTQHAPELLDVGVDWGAHVTGRLQREADIQLRQNPQLLGTSLAVAAAAASANGRTPLPAGLDALRPFAPWVPPA